MRVVLLVVTSFFLAALPARAATVRVLMLGDSAAFFPYFMQSPPALRDAFVRYGNGMEQWQEDGQLALLDRCAEVTPEEPACLTIHQWHGSQEARQIVRSILLQFPQVDVLHLSMGLNDFHQDVQFGIPDEARVREVFQDRMIKLRELLEFYLSVRPDVRIVINGYDYMNLSEGIEYDEAGNITAMSEELDKYYSALWGERLGTREEVEDFQRLHNWAIRELASQVIETTRGMNRVHYVNQLGVLHAIYGIPQLDLPPLGEAGMPGGKEENYTPLAGGWPDLFTPIQYMQDPTHQSPEGYIELMLHAVEEVYAEWLMDISGPQCLHIAPAGDAEYDVNPGEVIFDVFFSEPVTGTDLLDFEVESDIDEAAISKVTGSAHAYQVHVCSGSAAGSISLKLRDNDSIYDAAWNPLGKANLRHLPGDGIFEDGLPITILAASHGTQGDCVPHTGEGEGAGDGEGEGGGEGEGEGNVLPDPALLAELLVQDFHAYDLNGDGRLNFLDVATKTGALVAGALFAEVDGGGDLQIQVWELLRIVGHKGLHSADLDGDTSISLTELLRVIQLFRVEGYSCSPAEQASEDGYRAGAGPTDCLAHASDYVDSNFILSLEELLRLIQIYNASGYSHCPDDSSSEDGFCIS